MKQDLVYQKILLVDDNPNNLFVLTEIIRQHFPETELLEAKSGLEALSIVNQEAIDIILMDVQMPEMDGFETAKLIHGRKKTSAIPIIFVTAFDPDYSRMKTGLDSGGIDYLTKPINDTELIRLLLLYQRFIKRERKINSEIEHVNDSLTSEIQERIRAEQTVRRLNEELESRVQDRTVELRTEIEERKKIEAQLKQTQAEITIVNLSLKEAIEEVRRVNAAKSMFLASMSHEIRTPMNSILGFTELLLMEETDPVKNEKLEIIQYSGNHLLDLINDILDLSKIEAGKMVIHNEVFALSRLMHLIYSVMKIKADDKKLEFRFDFDIANDICILADEKIISQILINLISNAIKFTDQGSVQINAFYDNEELTVYVEDTGIGIPANKIKSIFEAFEQAHDERQISREGTGLGLAITSKLVDLLEGSLTVTSIEGKGTEFILKLPLGSIVSCEGLLPVPEHYPSPHALHRKTGDSQNVMSVGEFLHKLRNVAILVVDDNAINQKLMKAVLANLHLECDQANDGKTALKMMATKDYQLVFMDIQMPCMDGVEVLAAMKQNPRLSDIYVLALTANAMEGDDEKYQAAGFDDYMTKPFRQETLRGKLISYLTKN
jgi:signal transduction histidine kinase